MTRTAIALPNETTFRFAVMLRNFRHMGSRPIPAGSAPAQERLKYLGVSAMLRIRIFLLAVLLCGICKPQWAQQPSGLEPRAGGGAACASAPLNDMWKDLQNALTNFFERFLFGLGKSRPVAPHLGGGGPGCNEPQVWSLERGISFLKFLYWLFNPSSGTGTVGGYTSQYQYTAPVFTTGAGGFSAKFVTPDYRARRGAAPLLLRKLAA